MSFDYWATHSFVHEYDNAQEQAIIFLLNGNGRLPHTSATLANVTDLNARLQLLAQATATNLKEVARAGSPRQPGGLLHLLAGAQVNHYLAQVKQNMATLGLLPVLPDLQLLPNGSFAIHFPFTLTSPYLSKDDTAFHLLDNPVKKEWLFKLPYIASTQWKGALRHTLWQLGYNDDAEAEKQKQMQHLFGTANDNDDSGERGRLYFYPSFFDNLSLEVINPHDRETGAGSLPIYFEAVPAGASATFTLLYTPLDLMGKAAGETTPQIFADLQLIAVGVQAMFTVYGFGAKTSSGFGLAELTSEGQLVVHYPDKKAQNPKPEEPILPKAVQDFLAQYPANYLDMKPKQLKEVGVPNAIREQTKKIKKLHQQYQSEKASYLTQLADWEATTATPPPKTTIRPFTSFNALSEIITTLHQTGGDT